MVISATALLRFTSCGLIALLTACTGFTRHAPVNDSLTSARLQADVQFLAHDLLSGREAGTNGHQLSALYVAEQFRAAGLNPTISLDGYYQPVPIISTRSTLPGNALVSLQTKDDQQALIPGKDYIAVARNIFPKSGVFTAPVVFVGYGVVDEQLQKNDYQDLDVKNKIVAMILGAPADMNVEQRNRHIARQTALADQRGALAVISIFTSQAEQNMISFDKLASFAEGMTSHALLVNDLPQVVAPNLRTRLMFSKAGATKLFSAANLQWSSILQQAETGITRRLELSLAATIELHEQTHRFTSPNVVAIVEGNHPRLREQVLVVTAHLDHLGMRQGTHSDDSIYNGALDNAAGVAVMLEAARAIKAMPTRRSIMFVATTAEENGLIGSRYFVKNPPLLLERIVANFNIDFPVATYPFEDIIIYQTSFSALKPLLEKTIAANGLVASDDPWPERNVLAKSDHASFLQQGIPVIHPTPGIVGAGKQAISAYMSNHLHRPSDEIEHIDFNQLTRFTKVTIDLLRTIANTNKRLFSNQQERKS